MPKKHDGISSACQTAITEIRKRLNTSNRPFVIALDGGSGCGKSTIATCIRQVLKASIIPCDDFLAANITDEQWDARTAEMRARDVINWRRIRNEVLEPLLAGQSAQWQPFDFESGQSADGTYQMSSEYKLLEPSSIIILDGIYSARQELSDLVNLSILIDVPIDVRHARLVEREDAGFLKAWHDRWDAAEAWYLTIAKPPASFDLVIAN